MYVAYLSDRTYHWLWKLTFLYKYLHITQCLKSFDAMIWISYTSKNFDGKCPKSTLALFHTGVGFLLLRWLVRVAWVLLLPGSTENCHSVAWVQDPLYRWWPVQVWIAMETRAIFSSITWLQNMYIGLKRGVSASENCSRFLHQPRRNLWASLYQPFIV